MSPSPGSVFYFDTSALVKRYVAETGSVWVTGLCRLSTDNLIATACIAKAEAAAAFARKHRSGDLSQTHYTEVLRDLSHDFAHQYLLVEVDQTLVDRAVELTQRQKLRGYDAVHLAATLTLNDTLTEAQLPPLTFVAADDNLLEAAQSEGLSIRNPNHLP